MFEDTPRKHPHIYRQVIRDYWRSTLTVGTLGFCCGIMRSLAIVDPEVGSLVNVISMLVSCVAALVLLFLWRFRSIQLSIRAPFRVIFPFVITAFLILPFAGNEYLTALAAILYALYSCAVVLMMIQSAQASRDRGINPVFIYGFVGGTVFLIHNIGFIAGSITESVSLLGITPLAAVSMISIYLLSIMFFVGEGGLRRVKTEGQAKAESIEFVALEDTKQDPRPVPSAKRKQQFHDTQSISHMRFAEQDAPRYIDRISKQSELLREHFRLSARETEVMELIARGNSVARIAQDLVVSENTIRTHSKRIYAKLAIHKKQELLDLMNEFEPRGEFS